jgi:hypothetical protein
LVAQAQGSAGLIRFLQLDLDHALTATKVAQHLDTEILDLLRQVTGTTGSGPA